MFLKFIKTIIFPVTIIGGFFIGFCSEAKISRNAKVYVCGHRGLVGSALMKVLQKEGFENIITKTSQELDLRRQKAVEEFFEKEKPEYVFVSAGKVGGIIANMESPADFLYDNVMIAANVIQSAFKYGVKKLLYLGSSCIYPRFCSQPIEEEYLLSGDLEPTNEGYALAKIVGLKLCSSLNKQYATNFISCMPTNLYGPNDNFDLKTGHVIPALIRRFYEAKQQKETKIVLWGTGKARREFLYIDDLGKACLFLMDNYTESIHINIGTGCDISIKELANIIKNLVGFDGEVVFDATIPDGMPKKCLNVNKINNYGWNSTTMLEVGLEKTFRWYRDNLLKEGKPFE